jgi:hypothetical protein
MPWFIWFFVATAIGFGLQLIPIVGTVLFFLAAPLWPIVFVNAGLAVMLFEALTGRIARAFALVPAIYLVGYFAMFAADLRAIGSRQAEVARHNGAVRVPFDPASQAIVWSKWQLSGLPGPSQLVLNYTLPVAYREGLNGRVQSARYARPDECRGQEPDIETLISNIGRSASTRRGDSCTIRRWESPSGRTVRVGTVWPREGHRTADAVTREFRISVVDSEGREHSLMAGTASHLPVFPMPVIGCELTSTRENRQCFARFWRSQRTSLVPVPARLLHLGSSAGALAALAQSLQLELRTP